MADLEILQHPLSKRGHNESSFRLTTPPTTVRRKGGRQARGGWKRSSHRRRAGGRQAAEHDGQRTRGRPAGRPLVRHPAAPRLSSLNRILSGVRTRKDLWNDETVGVSTADRIH